MLGITSFRKMYEKIVRSEGQYLNGEWVEGKAKTLSFSATIQPLAMDKLSPQLQGRYISSAIKIYTQERLNVAGENLTNGDVVLFEGEPYTVANRATYRSGVLEHFRYQAVRVGNSEPENELEPNDLSAVE